MCEKKNEQFEDANFLETSLLQPYGKKAYKEDKK